jgi:hypothetical protein
MPSARAECLGFPRLVSDFSKELSIDVKKAKIALTPISLETEKEPDHYRAYLLADQESCSVRGDCDSVVYLEETGGCYRAILSFRGKWAGIERKTGRELASIDIDSRFEGESVREGSPLRIERRRRRFEYDSKAKIYVEVSK